jgi:glycosyltransferase involved in cell wall biosynthesis
VKITMVHPRLDHRGGAENLLCWLASGLARRGHAVRVLTRSFSPELWGPGAWKDVAVHTLPRQRDHWLGRGVRQRRRAHLTAGLCSDADVVVSHNFPATLWTGLAPHSARRPRLVWYCNEPPARLHWRTTQPDLAAGLRAPDRHPWLAESALDHAYYLREKGRRVRANRVDGRLEHRAVRRFDAILCNSRFVARAVEAVYGLPGRVCQPGAPSPPDGAATRAAGRDDPTAAPWLAWVGSPLVHKNAAGFLRALRVAVHERGARDLRVRATGLDEPRFRALAEREGVADVVRFEPWLSDDALHALLAGARLLAYPSLDEPFGLVPVEAMALSRPVVASSRGGPAEVVVPGETGLLADPLDPAALADAVLALWRDPGRAQRMGAAGRRRYLERFTLEAFVERFEAQALPA